MKKESYIFLGKETTLNGSVETSQLVLEGSITGDIKASGEVLLKNGSSVVGDILTRKILVEEGYVHEGNIRLGFEHNEETNQVSLEKADETLLEENEKSMLVGFKEHRKDGDSQRLW